MDWIKQTDRGTNRTQRCTFGKYGLSLFILVPIVIFQTGCGTTKWSDTGRTATEQILITTAMDQVVDEFDFSPLSGRKIFIKKDGINCTDSQYLLTILRQQLAANGVLVKDKEEIADYILEIAPGAVGTNRYDLMYGIQETKIPSIVSGGTTSSIPEFALVKRTDQKAQVKLMLWVYNRQNGTIIWQSGNKTKTTSIRNRWIFGIGPITSASFDKKMQVGGSDVKIPTGLAGQYTRNGEKPSVQTEAIYCELDQQAIDRLDKIRKDGRYRLQTDEARQTSSSKSESVAKESDNKEIKKTVPTDSKPEIPQTASQEPPKMANLPSPKEPSGAVIPSNVDVKPTGEKTQEGKAISGPASLEAPHHMPTLQFGDMQLPLNSVYVPQQ